MRATARCDIRDGKLPAPMTILLIFEPYAPSLHINPDDTIYPPSLPSLEVKVLLSKKSDLILFSKLMRSGYVQHIYGLDNATMEFVEATRRGYLPLTLHYYYDPGNDRIVYVKFKDDKILVKPVLKNVSAHIEHFINTGEYPNVNKRLINLMEKIRYIIS